MFIGAPLNCSTIPENMTLRMTSITTGITKVDRTEGGERNHRLRRRPACTPTARAQPMRRASRLLMPAS